MTFCRFCPALTINFTETIIIKIAVWENRFGKKVKLILFCYIQMSSGINLSGMKMICFYTRMFFCLFFFSKVFRLHSLVSNLSMMVFKFPDDN